MFAGPRKAHSPGEHLLPRVNSASRVMFCGVVCVILASVTALSARHSLRPARLLPDAAREPRVRQALAQLGINAATITDEQVRISEIPAPPFREAARGEYLAKLLASAGLKVHTDEVGNVVGERTGSSPGDLVMVAAHLDTVFPVGTDVHA